MYRVNFRHRRSGYVFTIRLEGWQNVVKWLGEHSGLREVLILREDV